MSSQRCRTLALGECLGEWPDAAWLEQPEMRLGGRRVASARRITVAGRAGFEIIELHGLDGAEERPACAGLNAAAAPPAS